MRFSVAVDQFWVEGCTSFMVMYILNLSTDILEAGREKSHPTFLVG